MYAKLAWIGLLLVASAAVAQDSPASRPRLGASPRPASAVTWVAGEGAPPTPDAAGLHQEVIRLKTEREALEAERTRAAAEADALGNATDEHVSQLRLRLGQLLTKVAAQSARSKPSSPEPAAPPRTSVPVAAQPVPAPPPPPLPSPAAPVPQKPVVGAKSAEVEIPIPIELGRPVDALALAQAWFHTQNYAGALKAYRLLDPASLTAENRLAVQYMTACCLRHLGKLDEASSLYREVANSKGDQILVDCAKWHLEAIQWRQQVLSELAQIRQRRKAWEAKP